MFLDRMAQEVNGGLTPSTSSNIDVFSLFLLILLTEVLVVGQMERGRGRKGDGKKLREGGGGGERETGRKREGKGGREKDREGGRERERDKGRGRERGERERRKRKREHSANVGMTEALKSPIRQ